MDWWDSTTAHSLTFTCTPTQHFSGRWLHDRDRTLWASWVVQGSSSSYYFAGDTGYRSVPREMAGEEQSQYKDGAGTKGREEGKEGKGKSMGNLKGNLYGNSTGNLKSRLKVYCGQSDIGYCVLIMVNIGFMLVNVVLIMVVLILILVILILVLVVLILILIILSLILIILLLVLVNFSSFSFYFY